jgi:RNA polymerase sigma factor (sigma-70 family)
MKGGQRSFLRHIEALFDAGAIGEQTDRQLLERFTGRNQTAAELAFTVLVRRHGPMVFRACRAILGDTHAAEDAFQATFLVLARKAAGPWIRGSLGPWLLAVASRTASCARIAASRRHAHERKAAERTPIAVEDQPPDDRNTILHQELNRLPEKYRAAVVLCDLEGLTQEQAAHQLGWPDGTVRSRLARGRERLRDRLTRRGLAPCGILAGTSPMIDVPSASLVESTVQAALGIAWGQAALGATASAIALMEGALRIMFWSKLKTTAVAALTCTLFCSTGLMVYRAMGRPQLSEPAAKQQRRDSVQADAKQAVQVASGAESPELTALGNARLEVARKMRDIAEKLWREGERSLVDYLAAQKRYDEVAADVTVKTEADRLRFLERQVETLKRIEEYTRRFYRAGQAPQLDVLTAELARLDAEYALAKARLKAVPRAK